MRKISSILTLLLLCCSVIVQAAVSFDSSKKYYIIENTTGRYVASGVTGTQGYFGLKPTDQKGDKFTFTAVGDKWTLQTYRGDNFGATTWNTANTSTQWTIAEAGDGLYTFYQNSSGNPGYLNYQSNHDPSLYVDGGSSTVNKFRIVEASPLWDKPEFGGTVWTWNTSTNKFDADGQTSTATPARKNNKGPVYKFVNAGTVTTAVNTATDTSDDGGVWVVGGNTNITTSMGRWAGNILVEENTAIANVTFSIQLKNTEVDNTNASLWTNGTVNINLGSSDNKTLDIANGGKPLRWFIGENGMVKTAFTSTNNASNGWDIQVVVADRPQVGETDTRITTTIKKQVVTWGADLSSSISSITVWYKNAEGVYTKLDNSTAVTYDASGITITYQGLGYEEKYPTLDAEKYITYDPDTKANFLETATSADDNTHWYVMTQTRGGETPMYDNYTEALKRASTTDRYNGRHTDAAKKYLVRFFPAETEGQYYIQFGTGQFINANLTTGSVSEAAAFKIYKVNDEDGRIGWNLASNNKRVDNDGAGNTLALWGTGQGASENNVWALYSVEFTDLVTINYSLSAGNGETYTGSYSTGWAYKQTELPTLGGATGYTLSNAAFTKSGDTYSATMNITFPFPVSSATVKNPTGIDSEFNSKVYWCAKQSGDNYIAASTNTPDNITVANASNFQWYIYPTLTDGVFSYKIQNKGTSLYMPDFGGAAQEPRTENNLVAEANAGSFYFMPCIGTGKGFSINHAGTIFMTINTKDTDNEVIWTWTKTGSHLGSNLAFPVIEKSEEAINEKFDRYVGITPLGILEGSTVIGPTEFSNPTVINEAIDAAISLNNSGGTLQEKYDFNQGTQGQILQTYLDMKAQHGALYNYQFTANYQYGTIILPCPSVKPDGLTFYTCTIGDDGVLTLTDAGNMVNNTPYIYEQADNANNKYTIIGWDKGGRGTYGGGTNCLTGTLKTEGEPVPQYSYVLAYQKSEQRQAFFRTDGTVTCPQHKCFLTAPSSTTAPKAFYFDNQGETTSIESIFGGENGNVAIYDLSGKRLNRLQKGVNIVNGHKVIVK